MYDAGVALSEHWVDVFVAALLAGLGWFVSDRFRALDARHDRAEDKFEEIEKDLTEIKERLSTVETKCDFRHSGTIAPE